MERLEYEPHAITPQQGARGIVERSEFRPVKRNAAAIREVEAGNQIEQSGFADAGFAHDGDVFTRRHLEVDVSQH